MWARLKREEKFILVFLVISISIVALTDFIFAKTPACSFTIYQLGRALNNLSLAYIASVIFYWIVVSIPENRKKRSINWYIKRYTKLTINDGINLLSEISKEAKVEGAEISKITETELKEILRKIPPYGQAPLIIGDRNASWLEFLFNSKARSTDFINRILVYIIYLDSEHVKLLTEVKDASYFNHLDNFFTIGVKINNPDIKHFSRQMHAYLQTVSKLQAYYEKNFGDLESN
jgi:hypothetical protein